jgi:hypothetical protein
MALELWMTTAGGAVRFYLDVNAQRLATALAVEADPGSPGQVVATVSMPPQIVDRQFVLDIDETGTLRRSTLNIPQARRFTVDPNGTLPAGYAFSLTWRPVR